MIFGSLLWVPINEYKFTTVVEASMVRPTPIQKKHYSQIIVTKATLFLMDVVLSSDEALVARDGSEQQYGLRRPFKETTMEEFRNSRLQRCTMQTTPRQCKTFTPLSIQDLVILAKKSLHKATFIVDLKPTGEAYETVLRALSNAIATTGGDFSRFIPQVYCKEDIERTRNYKFQSLLLAAWKYNLKDVDIITMLDATPDIRAVSLWWHRINESIATSLLSRGVVPLVHGKNTYVELPAGVGCFIHGATVCSIETTKTTTLPLHPKPWSTTIQWTHKPLYDVMEGIVSFLAENGVASALGGGSYIGSMRHHGHVPMNDKDGDLWVFTTNETVVVAAMKAMQDRQLIRHWGAQNDGIGPNPTTGFGYHIDVVNEDRYLDIWLYAADSSGVHCVGRGGGCRRWFQKYMKTEPPTYVYSDYFPLIYRPFGPYLMPTPHGDRILLEQYGETWRTTCGGWQRGMTPCTQFYADYPFVFKQPNGIEALRQGESVLSTFDPSVVHP